MDNIFNNSSDSELEEDPDAIEIPAVLCVNESEKSSVVNNEAPVIEDNNNIDTILEYLLCDPEFNLPLSSTPTPVFDPLPDPPPSCSRTQTPVFDPLPDSLPSCSRTKTPVCDPLFDSLPSCSTTQTPVCEPLSDSLPSCSRTQTPVCEPLSASLPSCSRTQTPVCEPLSASLPSCSRTQTPVCELLSDSLPSCSRTQTPVCDPASVSQPSCSRTQTPVCELLSDSLPSCSRTQTPVCELLSDSLPGCSRTETPGSSKVISLGGKNLTIVPVAASSLRIVPPKPPPKLKGGEQIIIFNGKRLITKEIKLPQNLVMSQILNLPHSIYDTQALNGHSMSKTPVIPSIACNEATPSTSRNSQINLVRSQTQNPQHSLYNGQALNGHSASKTPVTPSINGATPSTSRNCQINSVRTQTQNPPHNLYNGQALNGHSALKTPVTPSIAVNGATPSTSRNFQINLLRSQIQKRPHSLYNAQALNGHSVLKPPVTPSIAVHEATPSTSRNGQIMNNGTTENSDYGIKFEQSVNENGQIMINLTTDEPETPNMEYSYTTTLPEFYFNGQVSTNGQGSTFTNGQANTDDIADDLGFERPPPKQRIMYHVINRGGKQKIIEMVKDINPPANGSNLHKISNLLSRPPQHTGNFSIVPNTSTPIPSTSGYNGRGPNTTNNGMKRILTMNGTIQPVPNGFRHPVRPKKIGQNVGKNTARQMVGVNGTRAPVRMNGKIQAVGINEIRQLVRQANGTRPSVRQNGQMQAVGINGARQPVGINGKRQPEGVNGMRSPVGVNGIKQPVLINGSRQPVGVNGMRPPTNGQIQAVGINRVEQPVGVNGMRMAIATNGITAPFKIVPASPQVNGIRPSIPPYSGSNGPQPNPQINSPNYQSSSQPSTSNQLSNKDIESKPYTPMKSLPSLDEDDEFDDLISSFSINVKNTIDQSQPGPHGLNNTNQYIVDSLGGMYREVAKRSFAEGEEYDYAATQAKKPSSMLVEMEEEVNLGVAETYATYMPSKVKIGKKHPDPVVETASLSSVAPVDVWYKLSLPQELINEGALSALQLESITYAAQAHEQKLPNGHRAGFLIGDGAGVGKGRTIAGIILENHLKGRERAVWVSVSNDLSVDAERDLKDIGADSIKVHLLNKMKYSHKIVSSGNGYNRKGVLFCTYSSLSGESHMTEGKYSSRRDQIVQWCTKDFDGLLIFDECHKAKNLCAGGSMKSTKTGQIVLELQELLPNARVLYASATGASEPKNMAYMARLGLWGGGTTFSCFDDFVAAVEEKGVGGMEIVAMDMKLRGMYIARQLSFENVKFSIREVTLCDDFRKMYNNSAKLWAEALDTFTKAANLIDAQAPMRKTMWGQFWSAHQRFFKYLCVAAKVQEVVQLTRKALARGCCVVIGLQSTGEANTLDQLEKGDGELSDFVSTAKGVFENLVEKHFPSSNQDIINKIIANFSASRAANPAPVYNAISEAEKIRKRQRALFSDTYDDSDGNSTDLDEYYDSDDEGRRAKIARIEREREIKENIENINNTLSLILNRKPKNFTATLQNEEKKEEKKEEEKKRDPTPADFEKVKEMKADLLEKIRSLGRKLPKNTLDELISSLGGSEKVAEMTGRKGRVVQTANGVQYESRNEKDVPLETLNIKERQRFMDGKKLVAIISEAASSGISLQSDRRAVNKRKRYHITLELPWSADKAVQQFGRTHRSNQICPPEYVFLITNLAGERRFASTVAKRLESLGALTHGDRRASHKDLSQFNIDNKYGKHALDLTMKAIVRKVEKSNEWKLPPAPRIGFFEDAAKSLIGVGLVIEDKRGGFALDKDFANLSKFLNRILGLNVAMQNKLFQYFTDTMTNLIEVAKKERTFDLGILDLGANDNKLIKLAKTTTFLYKHATGIAPIELHKLIVEGGMCWTDAKRMFQQKGSSEEGFYASNLNDRRKRHVILLIAVKSSKGTNSEGVTKYMLYKPNTGKQRNSVVLSKILENFKKVSPEEVHNLWEEQYQCTKCSHLYYDGHCKTGPDCESGIRRKIYHVLAGSVLPIWRHIENAIEEQSPNKNKMQVIRLKTVNDKKIVGTVIKNKFVDKLLKVLMEHAEDVKENSFMQEK